MHLTIKDIENDIQKFQDRIEAAREKLIALPATEIDWKEHKKIKAKRHELESEISHVRKLIGYAIEALEDVSQLYERPMTL